MGLAGCSRRRPSVSGVSRSRALPFPSAAGVTGTPIPTVFADPVRLRPLHTTGATAPFGYFPYETPPQSIPTHDRHGHQAPTCAIRPICASLAGKSFTMARYEQLDPLSLLCRKRRLQSDDGKGRGCLVFLHRLWTRQHPRSTRIPVHLQELSPATACQKEPLRLFITQPCQAALFQQIRPTRL